MKRIGLGLVVLSLAWIGVVGQVKYSNEFLSIGVGARTMGMGGAGVAWVDDVTAGYWNPANLVLQDSRMDFSLMHAEYFAGLAKYDYGSAYLKLDDQSGVALSMIRLGVDDIPNTLELIDEDGNIRYDRITTFSAADLGIIASYSRKIGIPGLSVGGNFKVVHRRTGDFAHAWGFGLDAAVTWQNGPWRAAAMARDITGTFNAWRFDTDLLEEAFTLTGNELPENSLEITTPRLILGGARMFQIRDKFTLAPVVDLHITFDGRRQGLVPLGFLTIDLFSGVEMTYDGWLRVRTGVGNFQRIPNLDGSENLTLSPNMGLGVTYRNFYIDYALTNIGNQGGTQYSNLVSLRLRVQ